MHGGSFFYAGDGAALFRRGGFYRSFVPYSGSWTVNGRHGYDPFCCRDFCGMVL
jgi:hypothetical protein